MYKILIKTFIALLRDKVDVSAVLHVYIFVVGNLDKVSSFGTISKNFKEIVDF